MRAGSAKLLVTQPSQGVSSVRIGVIACDMMRSEIEALVDGDPRVVSVAHLSSSLHMRPEELREAVEERVRLVAREVDAVFLGYGGCRALGGIGEVDLGVPVFLPRFDDCISMLLSPERRAEEIEREAGTWFMSPGWAGVSREMIIREMGFERAAELGHDPVMLAKRMFSNYRRGLLFNTGLPEAEFALRREQAHEFCEDLGLALEEIETGPGSGLKDEYERFRAALGGGALRRAW